MKNRLFKDVSLERLETKQEQKKQFNNPSAFECLNGNDVITAKVSDHHPVIHDGVLFWNILKLAEKRKRGKIMVFNNGLGIEENRQQYRNRLGKIGQVISEIVYHNPDIEAIGLCEGPIELLDIDILMKSFKKFEWMERFYDRFHKPSLSGYNEWGLLLLADKRYRVAEMSSDLIVHPSIFKDLANRFQLWQLTKDEKQKFLALAHFPFSGDEHVMEKTRLSQRGNIFCDFIDNLLNEYANEHLIFCADFNFNPYLIKKWQDRALDQITNNNSILLTEEKGNKEISTVTVDGILLSAKEKQKYYISRPSFSLSHALIHENSLFKCSLHKQLERIYHENSEKHFKRICY